MMMRMASVAVAASAVGVTMAQSALPGFDDSVFTIQATVVDKETGLLEVSVSCSSSADWLGIGFGNKDDVKPMPEANVVVFCPSCTRDMEEEDNIGFFKVAGIAITASSRNELDGFQLLFQKSEAGGINFSFRAKAIADLPLQDATYVLAAAGPVSTAGDVVGLEKHTECAKVDFDMQGLENTSVAQTLTLAPSLSPSVTVAQTDPPAPLLTRAPTVRPTRAPTPAPIAPRVQVLGGMATFSWELVAGDDTEGSNIRVLDDNLLVRGELDMSMDNADWLAVGISETGVMVGTHAVVGASGLQNSHRECLLEGYTACPDVEYSGDYGLQDVAFAQEANRLVLSFVGSGIAGQPFDLTGETILVFAAGLSNDFSVVHSRTDATYLDLTRGSTAVGTPKPTLFFLHGVLMLVAYGYMFPLGFLPSVCRRLVGAPTWFILHRNWQILGVIVASVGFGLIVYHQFALGRPHFDGPHAILGFVLFVATWLQPLLAVVARKGGMRQAWRISHFLVALFIVIGGLVASYMGGKIIEKKDLVAEPRQTPFWIAFWVAVGTSAACVAAFFLSRCVLNGIKNNEPKATFERERPQNIPMETEPPQNIKGDPGPFFQYSAQTRNPHVQVVNLT